MAAYLAAGPAGDPADTDLQSRWATVVQPAGTKLLGYARAGDLKSYQATRDGQITATMTTAGGDVDKLRAAETADASGAGSPGGGRPRGADVLHDAQNITGVAESARSTSQSAADSEQATVELARLSTELSDLVSGFPY